MMGCRAGADARAVRQPQPSALGLSAGLQHRSRIRTFSCDLDSITPALQDVDAALSPDQQLARAVEANVRWTMRQVLESREGEGKARTASGEYKLVGAIYDIASGRVRFLESA